MKLPDVPPEITKKLLEILVKLVEFGWKGRTEGKAKRKAEAEASIALSEAIREMLSERPNVAKAERKFAVASQVENLEGLDSARKILKKIKALEAETEEKEAPTRKIHFHRAKRRHVQRTKAKKAPAKKAKKAPAKKAKKATVKKAPAPRPAG
ncbi:hypothetical protein PQR02_04935 [Paraburkholderia sediminicola]|uniref:Uncharacterized protein n=1 Tax=Paraburkholderia rhynchosiae TaxID=487049 RepID=A0ACC7N9W6_9BURK